MSEDDLTMHFLTERTAWPMVHIVNPFMHYIIFQNVKATIMLFYLWETLERLAILVCAGTYCFFSEDEEREPMSDSLIGDILEGMIGLLLAKTFVIVFNVPRWNLGFRRSFRLNVGRLWVKRCIQFFLFFISFYLANFRYLIDKHEMRSGTSRNEDSRSIKIGVFASMLLHTILLIIYWRLNRSKLEKKLYWTCTAPECNPRGENTRRAFPTKRYNQIYIGLIVTVLFLESSVTYSTRSHYEQAWLHAFITLVVFTLIAYKKGRIAKMADLFSCGVYSVYTRDYHYSATCVEHNPYFEEYNPLDIGAQI